MTKMTTTRRSFLKSSLATGAAALVCGTKGQAKVLGANDRLRIAVAGLNGRGGSHIGGWMGQKNVEIAYLAEPLALIDDHLGRPGRHACLRREADEPRRA